MKIEISPYQLVYRGKRNTRQGALLRIHYPDGRIGYADCHPWVELGDAPLDTQLAHLKQGKTTPLTDRSLFFAALDADARAKKISLFTDCKMPSNHWLISDITQQIDLAIPLRQGFSAFKVKVGNNLSQELQGIQRFMQQLPDTCSISFDGNYRLSQTQFMELHQQLHPYAKQIRYYEDPFPFEATSWRSMQKNGEICFAHDRDSEGSVGHPDIAPIIIHKPAIQNDESLHRLHPQQQVAFTSYLDHPLGQLTAAYVSAKWIDKLPHQVTTCGLLSHFVYEPTSFSEQLHVKTTRLVPPPGTGFGFDELLRAQPWSAL